MSEVSSVAGETSATGASTAPNRVPLGLPTDRELVMRVMPLPADSNHNGDIFGGWIMAQVDLAGAVLPSREIGRAHV